MYKFNFWEMTYLVQLKEYFKKAELFQIKYTFWSVYREGRSFVKTFKIR